MSATVAERIAVALSDAEAAITTRAQASAQESANNIKAISGGAITPTPEQVAAIQDKAVDDLRQQLAEQIMSVANVFDVQPF